MKNKSNKKFYLNFQRLMVTFTVMLSLIICSVTIIFVYIEINNYQRNKDFVENMAVTKINDNLQNKTTIVNNISNFIGESQNRIDNIRLFLKDNPTEYNKKIIDDSYGKDSYFNWPVTSSSFYIRYPSLKSLSVRFNNDDKAFTSNDKQTYGKITNVKNAFSSKMIYGNIVSPQYKQVVGLIGINFDNVKLVKSLDRICKGFPLQLVVVSNDGRVLYHYTTQKITSEEKKRIDRLISGKTVNLSKNDTVKSFKVDSEYTIYTFCNNFTSKKILIVKLLPIILGGLFVLAFLLVSFRITFNKYRYQLGNIIKTTEKIRKADLNIRIKTDKDNFDDLNILSHSINDMLDQIDNYVNTIYKMKIAQQEAHMKALQAQISPHFMANTLEYIRMSALDIGARDLAKVVYSFAALLRSNVDNNTQSTIKNEAKLIKNYIYLYQVRFPDKLAFQIDISPELMNIKIPKFTLQPIVENYLVHGVDFTKNYNAIEVKGRMINNQVEIKVIDNGHHLDIPELSKLNLKLQEPIKGEKSIGLQNVYARMHNYTKNFKMRITNNQYGGITVSLSFDYEG